MTTSDNLSLLLILFSHKIIPPFQAQHAGPLLVKWSVSMLLLVGMANLLCSSVEVGEYLLLVLLADTRFTSQQGQCRIQEIIGYVFFKYLQAVVTEQHCQRASRSGMTPLLQCICHLFCGVSLLLYLFCCLMTNFLFVLK